MPVIINGTTGISGTDGSASTPAVQGTDANTGIFFPAADTIAFSEGGTEVMRINATGVVNFVSPPTVGGVSVLTGPAFSAYRSSDQTGISDAVFTKVQLNLENFDTASCFDNVTNYRFTPNVAGYYQINGTLYITGSLAVGVSAIYKNGSLYCYGSFVIVGSSGTVSSVSSLVYLNGTSDYVELYGYGDTTSGTPTFSSAGGVTSIIQFSGCLVRAA